MDRGPGPGVSSFPHYGSLMSVQVSASWRDPAQVGARGGGGGGGGGRPCGHYVHVRHLYFIQYFTIKVYL
jgi:hypothetical protein